MLTNLYQQPAQSPRPDKLRLRLVSFDHGRLFLGQAPALIELSQGDDSNLHWLSPSNLRQWMRRYGHHHALVKALNQCGDGA